MGWLHVMADAQGGGYISPWKIIPLLVVVLIWARLMTWADNDAHAAHLPRIPFNISFLAGLILAFFLFLYRPNFLFGIIALLVIFGAEVGVYLYMRNQVVGMKDLKKQFNAWIKSFGSQDSAIAIATTPAPANTHQWIAVRYA